MKLARLAPIAPIVALVALAGCSPSPTTAADVEGTAISEASLTESFEGCSELGFQVTRQDILAPLVVGELVNHVAEENDIEFDQAARDEMVQSNPNLQALVANEGCSKVADAQTALTLLFADLTEVELMEAFQAADVKINPRYGELDLNTFVIGGSGSVSVPAGTGN